MWFQIAELLHCLLAHKKSCKTHSLSLQMQRICLAIWLMFQRKATSNCRRRINTYSEKGNGANQTTPQSIEEGNWFKDETQACLPMWRARQPSFSLSLSNHLHPCCYTFDSTFHWKLGKWHNSLFSCSLAVLNQWAQSPILGSDDLRRYKSHLNWSPELSAIKILCRLKRGAGIHMKW